MPKASGAKCTCNLGFMVVAWVLFALGIWVLVGGFATQLQSSAPTMFNGTVLGWYFVAIVLLGVGKMAKWKSHGACPVHNM